MANFLLRIAGAAALHSRTYEEVKADRTATSQALLVILLASVAAGFGASGWRTGIAHVLALSAVMAPMALLAWICRALLTFEIGSRILAEPQTRTDIQREER